MTKLIGTSFAVLLLISGHTFASTFPPIIKTQSGSTIQETKEDKPIGTKLFNITAQDRNGGTVTIEATGVTRDIVTINLIHSGSRTTGEVLLKKTLDREAHPSYRLRFIAISSNKYAPSSALEVTLLVNDVNDEPPQFSQPFYLIQVSESHSLTDAIDASISATDPDIGPRGSVSFYMQNHSLTDVIHASIPGTDSFNGAGGLVSFYMQPAGQTSALYGDTFTIDEISGKLHLNKPLDYETLAYYQYKLIAKDGGSPRLSSTADLLITILDVQDTPPIFHGLPYMTTVRENYSVGYNIFSVLAVDGDTGIPNKITYSISSGNCTEFLAVEPDTGIIYITKVMDRDDGILKELHGVCIVGVKASEVTSVASNMTETVKPFIINIEDVNDNPPKFKNDTYNGSVKENMTDIPITISGEGLHVYDIDQIGNNHIQLQVYRHDSEELFHGIEASPQEVYSNGAFLLRLTNNFKFDYENYTSIDIIIKATDKKNSSMTGEIIVHITINDTNDNDPIFKNSEEIFFVHENSCFNTTVTTIEATDADSGIYSKITYRLQGSNSFDIDNTSGRIFVHCDESCNAECNTTNCDGSCLDRERKDVYYLTVEAEDGGGRRTSVSIVVYLNDTNDNKPVFRDTSYRVGLNENSQTFSTGNSMFKVEATDKDIGNNSKISYRIVSSKDNQGLHKNFTIDEENGAVSIKINNSIDYEKLSDSLNGQINLTLVAEDHGSPEQSTNITLTVDIKDVNDNAPNFQHSYNGMVKENSKNGAFVLAVSAVDDDKTIPNNQIAYFIEKGGSDQFTIDGTSGNITVQVGAKLDREIVPSYNLTVIAIDKGIPQKTGIVIVPIGLEDENDTPPSWKNLPQTIHIHENSTYSNVTTCVGTDADINNSLSYSTKLISAMDIKGNLVNVSQMKDMVVIDDMSGKVSVENSGLDAEAATKLMFEVTVNDINTLENVPNATSELMINIIDINDSPPVFPALTYSASILENVLDDTYVTSVKATDADINEENRKISYYIDDTNLPFAIDHKSGVVKKVKKVDREKKDLWNVTIRATDSVFNTCTVLRIDILDFNDNTPYFLNETYVFYIKENKYNNTRIGTIYANDEDEGVNANIRFFITGGDLGHFKINISTGDLLVDCEIDREKHFKYDLTITIQDSPIVSADTKRNSTQAVIYVQDVNDNAPTFTSDSYKPVRIKESTSIGTTVRNVEAIDKDSGNNSNVWYSLGFGGNVSDDWFAINTDTGAIYINNSLKDQAGNYTMEVIASDEGDPSLKSSFLLGIHIVDEVYEAQLHSATPCNCSNSSSTSVHPAHHGNFYSGQSFVLCEGQTGYIQCEAGQLIRILSAVYGRTTDSICPSYNLGTLRCQSHSSTDHTKWSCNGYRRCRLFADNSVFGEPCIGIDKYLEVSFHCVNQSDILDVFG